MSTGFSCYAVSAVEGSRGSEPHAQSSFKSHLAQSSHGLTQHRDEDSNPLAGLVDADVQCESLGERGRPLCILHWR